MIIGKTFLSDEDKISKKRHLFVVIATKDIECVAVPINTWRNDNTRQDASCILNVGDNSFIKHKSWVNFGRAKVIAIGDIYDKINRGIFIAKSNMEDKIVNLICSQAQRSIYFPRECLAFFTDYD